MPDQRWATIVHGGARTIAANRQDANRAGCIAAVEASAAILRGGGTALDAAEAAVRQLEDDATFNAGCGSVPTAAGDVEMDAAIMDATTLDVGAVAALSRVRNPVSVARMVLTEPPVLLVGAGALAFARQRGVNIFDAAPTTEEEGQHDTVGCIAMDRDGRLAVATSTGGLPGQLPGRVGDAPIPGCGFYADNGLGAAAISGDGESILRVSLAMRAVDAMRSEPAPAAAAGALRILARVGGEAGIIALDRNGRFGVAHNSEHFAVALAASWMSEAVGAVHQDNVKGYLARG